MALSGVTSKDGAVFGVGGFVWGLRLLCGAALLVSGYLAVTALRSEQVAGCGGAIFDCGHVLTSRWASIFGLPVSVPAVLLYGGMLGALWFCQFARSASIRQRAWDAVVTGAIAAGLAAIWFLSLQMLAIGHLCLYCLIAHTCGLAMCGAILWWRPVGIRRTAFLSAVSATGVSLMIGAQLLAKPPETFKVEHHEVQKVPVESAPIEGDDFEGDDFIMEPPGTAAEDVEVFEPEVFEPVGANPALEERQMSALERHRAKLSCASVLPTAFIRALVSLPTESDPGAGQANATESETQAAEPSSKTKVVPEATNKRPERRLVSISGKTRLDVRQWPLLGSPDAKFIFVEMFDYTCSHCRETHQTIKGAQRHFGDDLAVVALPVPLDRECNPSVTSTNAQHADACEIAKIAIAVWRIDPAKFEGFHDWLFETSRSAADARLHAALLVGEQALSAELARPTASQYIAKHVELYRRAGAGSVPKLLFSNSTVVGEVRSTQSLVDMIRRDQQP